MTNVNFDDLFSSSITGCELIFNCVEYGTNPELSDYELDHCNDATGIFRDSRVGDGRITF